MASIWDTLHPEPSTSTAPISVDEYTNEHEDSEGASLHSEDAKLLIQADEKKSLKSFVFVTGNANKLREVQQILATGDSGITVTNQALDVPEVQGSTQEVAIAKCKSAAKQASTPPPILNLPKLTIPQPPYLTRAPQLGKACVTEDTALCFQALGGLPGPYIKDFLTQLGVSGLPTLLSGFPTNRAHALCTFAYSPAPTPTNPDPEPILFEGITEGQIVPARGDKVFGWDPVFQPDEGNGLTYAEMDPAEKNKISHRYKALQKLKGYLQEQGTSAP